MFYPPFKSDFSRKAYDNIRVQFSELIQKHPTLQEILNQKDKDTATQVGTYLNLIENKRNKVNFVKPSFFVLLSLSLYSLPRIICYEPQVLLA